jgi:hypothetical protein
VKNRERKGSSSNLPFSVEIVLASEMKADEELMYHLNAFTTMIIIVSNACHPLSHFNVKISFSSSKCELQL